PRLGRSQDGGGEGLLGGRVGGLADRWVVRELAPPSLAHERCERWSEVAEEWKRGRGGPLLAHEEEWRRGREEQDGHGGGQRPRRHVGGESVTPRPVADLVVVLQERDEGRGRQVRAWLPARGTAPER